MSVFSFSAEEWDEIDLAVIKSAVKRRSVLREILENRPMVLDLSDLVPISKTPEAPSEITTLPYPIVRWEFSFGPTRRKF